MRSIHVPDSDATRAVRRTPMIKTNVCRSCPLLRRTKGCRRAEYRRLILIVRRIRPMEEKSMSVRRPAEQGASFSEPGGWIGRGGYREAGGQSGVSVREIRAE